MYSLNLRQILRLFIAYFKIECKQSIDYSTKIQPKCIVDRTQIFKIFKTKFPFSKTKKKKNSFAKMQIHVALMNKLINSAHFFLVRDWKTGSASAAGIT